MALNIKDAETERLASEVAALTGESKTRAVRTALLERRARLSRHVPAEDRAERMRRILEEEIWPQVPSELRDKPLTKAEEEQILGIGPEGF
jgi:antitoxin VapB